MKLPMEEPRSAQATPEISSHITRISPPPPPSPPLPADDAVISAPLAARPTNVELVPEPVCDGGREDSRSPLRPSDSRKRRGYVIGIGRGVDTEYEQPEPTPEWWRICCARFIVRTGGSSRRGNGSVEGNDMLGKIQTEGTGAHDNHIGGKKYFGTRDEMSLPRKTRRAFRSSYLIPHDFSNDSLH